MDEPKLMLLPKPRPKRLEKRESQRDRERAWQRLRLRVKVRDDFKCRVCRNRGAYDAHHLLARSLGGRDVLHNLIAVCRQCHADIHGHVVVLRWRNEANRAGSLTVERRG